MHAVLRGALSELPVGDGPSVVCLESGLPDRSFPVGSPPRFARARRRLLTHDTRWVSYDPLWVSSSIRARSVPRPGPGFSSRCASCRKATPESWRECWAFRSRESRKRSEASSAMHWSRHARWGARGSSGSTPGISPGRPSTRIFCDSRSRRPNSEKRSRLSAGDHDERASRCDADPTFQPVSGRRCRGRRASARRDPRRPDRRSLRQPLLPRGLPVRGRGFHRERTRVAGTARSSHGQRRLRATRGPLRSSADAILRRVPPRTSRDRRRPADPPRGTGHETRPDLGSFRHRLVSRSIGRLLSLERPPESSRRDLDRHAEPRFPREDTSVECNGEFGGRVRGVRRGARAGAPEKDLKAILETKPPPRRVREGGFSESFVPSRVTERRRSP